MNANKNQTNMLLHSKAQTCEREAQESLQQACKQEAHKSEPSLETIAQYNRSEHEKNNPNPTKNTTSTPSKISIAQQARRD
ncbi:hypothetical protein F8M41_014338 [Gigaspora margarita]|uniref:Uncharacterized protein n=1 Tax=Gigaspora margarita TaxID=4874 RepID=A0A8H3WWM3_GIGMA|nr:hypothetical protein F8M41_014338 [Gigaspora margarita]